MRASLQNWINEADSVRHLNFFSIAQMPIQLARITNRVEDYYITLVGELFSNLHAPGTLKADWAQLGNAFLQFAAEMTDQQLSQKGISKEDAILFAASSFYFGDYPASACLAMRLGTRPIDDQSLQSACYDFLARPQELRSQIALNIREFLRNGESVSIDTQIKILLENERNALSESPEAWIRVKLLNNLLLSFRRTNLREILPEGYQPFWTPLVSSLINRRPSSWEFFPSQIEAIQGGLLTSENSFSLQMPTGAGKTTLCETLLYYHLKNQPQHLAIMIVPYRSLASELRNSLVRQLNSFGIPSRCAYGGTVPTGDEIHELVNTQVVIATPESLSGLLSADADFTKRISLVICDEGHLLDGDGRGISLELLLARLKARPAGMTRFIFISAIVPNIEEINSWLGGTDQTVIRSTYRPALAEFSVLNPIGKGANKYINLKMHPHEALERQFSIEHFLKRSDFIYLNPITRRQNTYDFSSFKTHAIATARKVLPMGAVAIFAMNKRGKQGAIGIGESFVNQLEVDLDLPKPIDHARLDALNKSIAYLEAEYGANWVTTRCLRNGAVLHHGDIPQETREILEDLLRKSDVKLVICTSTLAEGVNLPIRTLVLYSVERRSDDGQMQSMLSRDIKNLVGRAGRPGSNTKGLVICVNPEQWQYIQPVAEQGAGEPVKGSLVNLIRAMTNYLTREHIALTNEFLEQNPIIHPLIDGVDSTLIELLSDEIGEEAFIEQAIELAAQTFAAQQLNPQSAENLRNVFALRASRLVAFRAGGRTNWAKQTGAKIRLIDSVEQGLLPLRANWEVETDPLSEDLIKPIFQWAWTHSDLQDQVRRSFNLDDDVNVDSVKERFFSIARLWMSGMRFREISAQLVIPIDDLLAVHTQGITFAFQTLIEQGISLLAKLLEAQGIMISTHALHFPEYLRFGAPNNLSKMLATIGVRHRLAYVNLGVALRESGFEGDQESLRSAAVNSLTQYPDQWRSSLGELIYQNTLSDLSVH